MPRRVPSRFPSTAEAESLPSRNEWIPFDVKPQMPPRPMPCIRHADPWSLCDFYRPCLRRRRNIQFVTEQILSVEPPINLHSPTQQPRPLRPSLYIPNRLNRPQ